MARHPSPRPFYDHQSAAMALLTSGAQLRSREGQFLGGIAFSDDLLTEKQRRWLDILLDRHGLPPMTAVSGVAGHA
jgi:hypothetical protein